ncbi:MAG: pilin [Candidatus Campbellbacteria bacterium]|nr:pilin [Candidatus Campbellbacteria bacterium]
MRRYISSLVAVLVLSPLFVFAQSVGSVITSLGVWVGWLIPIIASLALLVFMWGIVKYLTSAGDADKAKEGKSIMIYGVIALFVLFSVVGLVAFIRSSLGLSPVDGPFTPPKVTL